MADSLDVGALAGRVELEDNSSVTLANVAGKVDYLSGKFDELNTRVKGVAEQHESLEGVLEGIGDRFEQVGERVAEYFAVREVAKFISDIGESALALDNLSKQTGINVEDLQVLGQATSEYGVDSDQLGRAIFQMSQRIAGGDQSAATALAMMGISLKDVAGLNGKDLFLKIESGLATLQGTAQDVAAQDLFGGRIGKSMIAFAGNADEALERAQNLGSYMSKDAVDQWAEFQRSVDLVGNNLGKLAGSVLAPVAQGFNILFDSVTKLGVAKAATGWFGDLTTLLGVNGGLVKTTAQNMNDLSAATAAEAAAAGKSVEVHKAAAEPLSAEATAAKFLSTIQVNAAQELAPWQEKDLAYLKSIGELNAKNAAAIGVNAVQFKEYEANVKATGEATKKYEEALTSMASVGASWHDTLMNIDGETVAAVKYYLDAGVSQEKLAAAYGLTAEQVKAINSDRTAEIQGMKDELVTAAALATAEEALAKSRLDNQRTVLDMQEKNDESYFSNLLSQGKITEAQYKDDVVTSRTDLARKQELIYQQELQSELSDLDKKNAEEVQKIQDKYDQGKTDEADYLKQLDEVRQTFDDKRTQAEEQYTFQSKQRQQALIDGFKTLGQSGAQSFEVIGEADAILNDDIDNTNKKVMTLDGSLMDAVKFKQQMDAGGTAAVTSANFEQSLAQITSQPGTAEYRDPYTLAKQGYSFQEVIAYAFNADQQGPLPPPQGPRIPGFKDGGVGDFGAGTIAVLHGREAVVPLDSPSAPAIGGSITNHIYVNGTAIEAANKIASIIMQQMKNTRQFGAA